MLVSAGLNGDLKVTESLTTSCAYDISESVVASVLPLMTTYAHFWLGMEPNSKTGRGDPVSVRL